MGVTVRRSNHQIGRTHVVPDKKVKALLPGRRRSTSGKKYTENRRNRSDMRPNTRRL
jgi:hypothetical protein